MTTVQEALQGLAPLGTSDLEEVVEAHVARLDAFRSERTAEGLGRKMDESDGLSSRRPLSSDPPRAFAGLIRKRRASVAGLDEESSSEQSLGSRDFSSSPESSSVCGEEALLLPDVDPVTDLGDVPSAGCIASLRPNVVTRSFVVAVVSLSLPLPCTSRWGGTLQSAFRLKLTVADDTGSGFGVTLWLPPAAFRPRSWGLGDWPDSFDRDVRALRPRDVICLRHLKLTEYRDEVHGSSRDGLTSVILLLRDGDGIRRSDGLYRLEDVRRAREGGIETGHVFKKACRVWDWLSRYTGFASNLPPDSP